MTTRTIYKTGIATINYSDGTSKTRKSKIKIIMSIVNGYFSIIGRFGHSTDILDNFPEFRIMYDIHLKWIGPDMDIVKAQEAFKFMCEVQGDPEYNWSNNKAHNDVPITYNVNTLNNLMRGVPMGKKSKQKKLSKDPVFLTKKIFQTQDYSKFSALTGQPADRAEKNMNKLLNEIKETKGNYLPIIVNENFEIIDGNTRLAACKKLNLPVLYEIITSTNIKSLQLMRHMNAAATPWTISNFIEFYSVGYKYKEFKTFKEFIDRNNVNVAVCGEFHPNINIKDVRNGTLPNIDYTAMQEKIDIYKRLIVELGDTVKSKRNIARTTHRFMTYGNLDVDRLMLAINKHWEKVLVQAKTNKVINDLHLSELLQKCYNFKLSKKNRVRLFAEEL